MPWPLSGSVNWAKHDGPCSIASSKDGHHDNPVPFLTARCSNEQVLNGYRRFQPALLGGTFRATPIRRIAILGIATPEIAEA
jgi:hypothetical protein